MGVITHYYHRAMTPADYAVYYRAQEVGQRCIAMYLWSLGTAQGVKAYTSVDNQWAWYFW